MRQKRGEISEERARGGRGMAEERKGRRWFPGYMQRGHQVSSSIPPSFQVKITVPRLGKGRLYSLPVTSTFPDLDGGGRMGFKATEWA